ncbi:MAG: hypothetical protein AB7U75_22035 [Hyphomicrobiaceae bacterium]
MSNTITDLRKHLFAALDGLADTANQLAIDRAKAIADVAREIIASAKVEVDFLRVTDSPVGTGFIDAPDTPRIGSARQPQNPPPRAAAWSKP